MPDDPKQELLVALAGPAVNIVLAALLLSVLVAGAKLAALTEVRLVGGDFLSKLMWVNVGLAVFNLLPAFPIKLGSVLQALLATRMDYVRATHRGQRWSGDGVLVRNLGLVRLAPDAGFYCALRLDRRGTGV
jgi:Zn-dependent protease